MTNEARFLGRTLPEACFETVEREFLRSMELSPRYVFAHSWFGYYLSLMGRFEEGITEMKRARGPICRAKSTNGSFRKSRGRIVAFAGKSVTSREDCDEPLSQDRFNRKPISLFAVAKEAQV